MMQECTMFAIIIDRVLFYVSFYYAERLASSLIGFYVKLNTDINIKWLK